VRQGAQDYLVKGQVMSDLLVRSMRYAIERKVWERKEKELAAEREREKERARELRALREELGELKKLSPAGLKKEAPIRRKKLTESVAEGFSTKYIQLLRSYTKTKDLDKEESLAQELCRKLIEYGITPKGIIELHLKSVPQVETIGDLETKRVTVESRMVLLKVMTNYASLLMERH